MAKDLQYRRLINTEKWRRLRRSRLTSHPLCERCEEEGRVAAAHEVHHRVPVETGCTQEEKRRLMYDPGNLMALCHECHVRIHQEMGRGSREENRERNARRAAAFNQKFFG